MSIPDAAIEAAAKAHGEHRIQTEPSSPGYRFAYCICRWRSPDVLSDEATGLGLMHEASYAIEAAMPAIREAIAREIEAESRTDFGQQWPIGLGHAVRIVRGGTA